MLRLEYCVGWLEVGVGKVYVIFFVYWLGINGYVDFVFLGY